MRHHSTGIGHFRLALLGVAALLGVGSVALWTTVASAAGTGYGPAPAPGTTVPGGFSNVVTSQTLPASGGTLSTSYDGETLSAVVPAGDFPGPVQVSITAPSTTPLVRTVTAFDISFSLDGKTITGALSAPITFTIKDPSVTVGDTVAVWNGTAWVAYSNATVSNGEVVIDVTTDPAFAVLAASAAPAPTVSGATTPTTGLPVTTIAAGALALMALGGLGLFFTRRRRTHTDAA